MKQRLLVCAAMAVGALVLLGALPAVVSSDETPGITLGSATAGATGGAIAVLLGALPAIGLAVLCGSMGTPLAAPFVLASALLVLAAWGGSGIGFLWRSSGPGDYVGLIVELLFWFALLAAVSWITMRVRLPLRRRLPWLASEPRRERNLLRGFVEPQSLLAGAVCAAAGGFASYLLVQSWETGQTLGGLVCGFALGAIAAQAAVGNASPGPIVLGAPMLVAIVGYLSGLTLESHDAMLAQAYRGELVGLAWSLPIHYASAGVLGTVIGIGIEQGMAKPTKSAKPADAAAPAA